MDCNDSMTISLVDCNLTQSYFHCLQCDDGHKQSKLSLLILLQPVMSIVSAYFVYYQYWNELVPALTLIVVVLTVILVQIMRAIHGILGPFTKMSHPQSKLIVMLWISPLCQVQQSLIEFIFHLNVVPQQKGCPAKYQWIGWYAVVLCVEMTVLSIGIRWKAFPAKDLFLWDRLDAMMRGRANSEVSMNVGVEVESDTTGFSDMFT